MKKIISFLFILSIAFGLSSCAAIGDIFKAGVWVGVIVVAIIVLIIILVARGRGSDKS